MAYIPLQAEVGAPPELSKNAKRKRKQKEKKKNDLITPDDGII